MNISLRNFLSRLAATVLLLVAVAAFQHAALAGAPAHQLVFTEQSSSLLLITYDGSSVGITVTPNGADSWSFTLLPSVIFTTLVPNVSWTEPENSSFFNLVHFNAPGNTGTVMSDHFGSLGPVLADGARSPFTVGGDSRDAGDIQVTFFDRGDVAVPEGGSTLALLTAALAGLCLAGKVKGMRTPVKACEAKP